MKVRIIWLSIGLGLGIMFIATPSRSEPQFQVSIKGGYFRLSGHDLNSVIDSHNVTLARLGQSTGMVKEGQLVGLMAGLGIEPEITMMFGRFGLSLGLTYVYNGQTSSSVLNYEPLMKLTTNVQLGLSLCPIELGLHYVHPIAKGMSADLSGGIGYCFGRLSYEMSTSEDILDYASSAKAQGIAEASGIEFHGGLGIEMGLSESIALLIVMTGRRINLNDWKGEETYSDSDGIAERRLGTLWYYEESGPDPQKSGANVLMSREKPQWTGMISIRKLDISPMVASMAFGLRIRL